MQTQLQSAPLKPAELHRLRDMLTDDRGFLELLALFIDQTVEDRAPKDSDFKRIYRNAMVTIAHDGARNITAIAQSSLERTFIRSLFLNFLRGDGLGLVAHSTGYDAPSEINEFRKTLAHFIEIKSRFHERASNSDFSGFLDLEAAEGRITWGQRRSLTPFVAKYYYGPRDARFHVTMQARFPNVKVGGRPVIADMYFWIPKHPEINVIVECDGFPYHSSEEKFTSDRQRDRAFKAQGYDVLRFSGSEVYDDPIFTAHELATYLDQRARGAAATASARSSPRVASGTAE
jgi:very-short-patch-repair endonuclease